MPISHLTLKFQGHHSKTSIPSPNPKDYATKVYPTEPTGAKTSVWIPAVNPKKPFLSWNHLSHSVVHALTIFKDENRNPIVRLLIQNRPALGNIDVIEAPAGKYADTDPTEPAILGAQRELEEETGLTPQKVMLLSQDTEDSQYGASIATSPGITNERKAFALILAEKTNKQTQLTDNEKKQNVRQLDLPLERFLHTAKFHAWLKEMKNTGYIIGTDILSLRGLLPGKRALKKFLELD